MCAVAAVCSSASILVSPGWRGRPWLASPFERLQVSRQRSRNTPRSRAGGNPSASPKESARVGQYNPLRNVPGFLGCDTRWLWHHLWLDSLSCTSCVEGGAVGGCGKHKLPCCGHGGRVALWMVASRQQKLYARLAKSYGCSDCRSRRQKHVHVLEHQVSSVPFSQFVVVVDCGRLRQTPTPCLSAEAAYENVWQVWSCAAGCE